MNERIRELVKQAKDWAYADHDGYTAQLLFEQKFAELIVRECALQCVHNEDMDRIEKHFGVKE